MGTKTTEKVNGIHKVQMANLIPNSTTATLYKLLITFTTRLRVFLSIRKVKMHLTRERFRAYLLLS